MKWFRCLPWLLLPLLALLLLRAFRPAGQSSVEKIGHQDEAAPLSLAKGRTADPRFHEISPWDRASVPEIDPADAADLLTEAEVRRLFEAGGPGRASTHAAADGWVLLAAASTENRDGAVILAHRLADGTLRFSLYRPLSNLRVSPGMLVGRGTRLASSTPSAEDKPPPPPSPLAILLASGSDPWQNLAIQGAEHIPGLGDEHAPPDD